MHEVSIMESTLEIVKSLAKENNLTKVTNIKLEIGTLTGVMGEALNFAFSCLKQDTVAKEATLEIYYIQAKGKCNKCNKVFNIDHFNKLCPECRNFCTSIVTGYELNLNSIEGE
jgi:hydrogenase nickel insertion protein HypA